jgi:hypothetical protein
VSADIKTLPAIKALPAIKTPGINTPAIKTPAIKLPAAKTLPGLAAKGVRSLVAARIEHQRQQHWAIKAAKVLVLVSLGAMGVAASTSDSDHHLKADGTKMSKNERPEGDVGARPVDDVGEQKDAGAKTNPDSDSNDLDESGAPSTN